MAVLAVGLGSVLTLAACSSGGSSGGSAAADAPATTTPTTTTEASAPATTRPRSTTSTGRTRSSAAGIPTDSAGIQRQLADTYGMTFTPDQGTCLGDAFADDPSLLRVLEPNYAPPLSNTRQVLDIYVRCLGGLPAAVHGLVENIVSQGQVPAAAAGCVEEVLGKLSEDDLTKVLSNDSSAQAVGQQLQRCVTGGDTATV
jgi:hypothetical protein